MDILMIVPYSTNLITQFKAHAWSIFEQMAGKKTTK